MGDIKHSARDSGTTYRHSQGGLGEEPMGALWCSSVAAGVGVCVRVCLCVHTHLRTMTFFILLTLEFCLEIQVEIHEKTSVCGKPGDSYCFESLSPRSLLTLHPL